MAVTIKLAVSNIAWPASDDLEMYSYLSDRGYAGLEIAPTRIFPDNPYSYLNEATKFAADLKDAYGLKIVSLQSIWYGRTERIFATSFEREALIAYSRKAVEFCVAAGCPTLVFGNPKNRNLPDGLSWHSAIKFFKNLASYASSKDCAYAIEPNPTIYGTNFLNYTADAFSFSQELGVNGFQVNLDFGTIIQNGEKIHDFQEYISLIRHVHISEPFLAPIQRRANHIELLQMLAGEGYNGYVSIEMKYPGELDSIKNIIDYLGDVANGL
ncbi:MAG: sugar phosphate isomerase/epimerase [Planctomycetaceae bacterium]|nr:sugar phosphate isomerase/epimerase [Planctomycetaceae bacterium]